MQNTRPYEKLKFYQDIREIRKFIYKITERFKKTHLLTFAKLIRMLKKLLSLRGGRSPTKQSLRDCLPAVGRLRFLPAGRQALAMTKLFLLLMQSSIRLASQMQDAARSAKQNIREGYRKGSPGEFIHVTSRNLDNKAQAMILVLFILAVIGALAGGLAVMWESEIRTRALDRDGLIAFYLAQAGIERAKIRAATSLTDYSNSQDISFSGGRYRFTVQPCGSMRCLTSTGWVLDGFENTLATRQIRLTVDGITVSGFPPPFQVDRSWQEQ